jgi:ParB family chromosome partitioning protein
MTALKKKDNKPSGMGLDSIGDLSALLGTPVAANAGGQGPREYPINLIDEDPDQPRSADSPGFSAESLKELAETIRERGVKSPISVRDNPNAPGRYLINHGARRFRATKLAGKSTIPGFLDNDYLRVDQVIENLQRNDLTAREIADWIGRELAAGKKKGDIASDLGKSASFVSQHVTLLDLPEVIAKPFNEGQIGDVTVVNELVTAFKKHPNEVKNWLADAQGEITRNEVKVFREFLAEKDNLGQAESTGDDSGGDGGQPQPTEKPKAAAKPAKQASKPMVVAVRFKGSEGVLVLNREPSAGKVWLRLHEGELVQANLSEIELIEVRPE